MPLKVPRYSYDGVAHMSEEVKNAAVVTPVAIVGAVVSTGIFGYFINVAICYGIGDLSTLRDYRSKYLRS